MCAVCPHSTKPGLQYRPRFFISVCLVANTPSVPTESGEEEALLTWEKRLAVISLQTHLENVRVVLSTIGTALKSI